MELMTANNKRLMEESDVDSPPVSPSKGHTLKKDHPEEKEISNATILELYELTWQKIL